MRMVIKKRLINVFIFHYQQKTMTQNVKMMLVVIIVTNTVTMTYSNPANMRRCPDVGPMLRQRRRRWHSIGPTSGQRLMLAGMHIIKINMFF